MPSLKKNYDIFIYNKWELRFMRLRLITIGKPSRETGPLINDYEKRLPKYCSFEALELKSEKDVESKLRGFIVILDAKGRQFASEEFAGIISQHSDITFVIGADIGLSETLKSKANLLLGFSKMTFPHQFARILLAEQVYRAFTILKKEKYHK